MASSFDTWRPLAEASADRNAIWLVRLRWAAIVGQAVTIVVAHRITGPVVRLGPLFAIVGIEIAFNLLVTILQRRGRVFREREIVGHLVFDLVALTALLHFSGGPSNPFNFLYLVQIVLAAVLLGAGRALILTAVSAALFAGLFVPGRLSAPSDGAPVAAGHEHHAGHGGSAPAGDPMMKWHLEGMWIAFVIAAILIVLFLGQILSELSRKRAELEQERERASRYERLSSLATLAAGAAHELATPLSTIAVVSNELSRLFARGDASAGVREDTALLRAEVARCQAILQRMSVAAGESRGGASRPVAVGDLLRSAIASVDADRVEVRASSESETAVVPVGGDGLRHAIRAVLDNAIAASPEGIPVRITSDADDGSVTLRITDEGGGIPESIRARVVEPFFTTKPPGVGMGLGLFVADNVLRQMGGGLALGPGPGGHGTSAVLTFPVDLPSNRDEDQCES